MNQPPEETSGSGDRAAAQLLLAATLLVTTCYLVPQIQSGWIPHDEGLLAQTAERVLGGEVPHRDFDDMYSGGLTYLHAAAMKVLGTRLSSMRWVLLLASLVGVACWYGIALCFAPPWAAMLSSLLCLAWSTPNYFASLPSWYSLVLASLTTWLLLQYHRQRQSRWLLAVGVCCGLSLMIKIVGLYMIAAALLSLLAISFQPEEGQQRQPPTSSGRLVSLVPGCLLGLLVLLLVRQHLGTGVLMLFVFPSVALAVMLVQIQSHGRGGALPSAIALAIRPGLIFSAGLAVPLVAWVGSYLAAGAVGDLVHGIFVLPRVRLDSVTSALASPWVLAWGLPAIVLLGLGNRRTPARQANLLALLAVVSGLPLLLACLMGPADGRPVNLLASAYKPLFLASFYLPALVVVSGILIVRQDHPARGERDTRLFIVLGPLAVMTLIQYPYSTGIYFCYYAPLLILGVLAVVRSQRDGWQRSWAGIGIFYLLFAVLMMNFSSPRSLGFVRQGIMRDGPLSERADLAVNLTDLGDYGELLELLETVTQPGEAIYAAPDCPEIYFLANRRNPTRTMYDLFDTRSDREQHLLQMLEDEKVKAVVVNVVPEFSRSLSGRFLAELQRRFPHLERIGIVRRNPSAPASPRFQVYWR